MKGFTEITEYEAIAVAGGRDPNIAKLIELIGYGVGALMKYLKTLKTNILKDGISLYDLLKRPEIDIHDLVKYLDNDYSKEVLEEVNIESKYEGYIKKSLLEVKHLEMYENKKIPNNIDYDSMHNLASEAKQKLKEVRPETIGQAMRISGVNPADISILTMYLKRG